MLEESLKYKHITEIEKAYIIMLKGHALSEKLANRCIQSCEALEIPNQIWEAIDGTKGHINIPDHLQHCSYLKWIKKINPALATTEVCVVLSHFTLWARCVEIDQPIVILEHDAVMLQKITHHYAFNNIIYLGSIEQKETQTWCPIPLHGQLNPNYRFLCRTHAYSIDPMIARQLIAHIIKFGITSSIDVFMRADIFPMMQCGIFAYDEAEESTTPEKDEKLNDPKMMKIHNKIYL